MLRKLSERMRGKYSGRIIPIHVRAWITQAQAYEKALVWGARLFVRAAYLDPSIIRDNDEYNELVDIFYNSEIQAVLEEVPGEGIQEIYTLRSTREMKMAEENMELREKLDEFRNSVRYWSSVADDRGQTLGLLKMDLEAKEQKIDFLQQENRRLKIEAFRRTLEDWAEEHGWDVDAVVQSHIDVAEFDNNMTVEEIAQMVALSLKKLPNLVWDLTEATKQALETMTKEQ